ncbi:MAG: rhodanese-like domain-containing protein [Mariprofundaceae bacterium]
MNLKHMTVNELYPLWLTAKENGRACCIVDVRQPEEYAAGHIPSVTLKPLDQINQLLKGLPEDEMIYLVCRSGMRSQVAAKILFEQGFENLTNIDGGTMEWIKMGYPIDKEVR